MGYDSLSDKKSEILSIAFHPWRHFYVSQMCLWNKNKFVTSAQLLLIQTCTQGCLNYIFLLQCYPKLSKDMLLRLSNGKYPNDLNIWGWIILRGHPGVWMPSWAIISYQKGGASVVVGEFFKVVKGGTFFQGVKGGTRIFLGSQRGWLLDYSQHSV